jgi:orotate phosphoribosyltransferase
MSQKNFSSAEFVEFLIANQVLRFGDFTTKSGRKTPYFINTGEYNTGAGMQGLARYYAQAFQEHFTADITNLFGPAYKGIPLSVATAMVLDTEFSRPISFTYNRKEVKDHGEGGTLVGNRYDKAEKVVIIEDVVTAGTSVKESMEIFKHYPHIEVVGLLVSVDRREKVDSGLSALQEIEKQHGIKTAALISIDDIINWVKEHPEYAKDETLLERMFAYREEYGA